MKKTSYSDITILVDMDDTIENLVEAWCAWLNVEHNLNVLPEEITDWNIAKFFPTLTNEQIFEPLHTEHFWETVKPKDGAVQYVKQLIEDGFNVYLCTSTDYRNVRAKFESITLKHFPFIHWRNVIIANCKQMIRADFLIDDGVHNLIGGDYIKILMSAPHNRSFNASEHGMIRVDDWKSIYGTIHAFASKLTMK